MGDGLGNQLRAIGAKVGCKLRDPPPAEKCKGGGCEDGPHVRAGSSPRKRRTLWPPASRMGIEQVSLPSSPGARVWT
jgi:hypothetical protein